ncbi:hypothetical protein QFZ56_006732 [Streptomyces achromogenes]|uniref:Uncharacterized protein n=1 Tax=Streptomyces achromogenes TaxID=67255 RepID=A0ABU0QAS9_STRAH|nr:hypothetical protein [Streptomyces achromogenes]MDQ0687769.1 hypothetical protein [Streptomyces achromogenes]
MQEEQQPEQPQQQAEQPQEQQAGQEQQADAAEAGRRARFGALPERVDPRDLVEERPATPRDPARDAYDPDQVAIRYGL